MGRLKITSLALALLFSPMGLQGQNGAPGDAVSSGDIVATLEPGSDLGAQINYAYKTDMHCHNGCRIVIPPGTYSMTTPVAIDIKGRNATVECSGSSTQLNWAGSDTATAFTFASNGSATENGWSSGIKSCNISSSSASATAVTFGLAAGDRSGRTAQGAVVEDSVIQGFGTQLDYESQAWNITVSHSQLLNASVHSVGANPSAVNMGENLAFVAVTVANSLNRWEEDAVDLNNGSVIATFVSSNFNNAEFSCKRGTCNLVSSYFENPGPTFRRTPWISIGPAVMTITGLTADDDDTSDSATHEAINVQGTLTWLGGIIFGQAPHAATVVTQAGGHVSILGDLDVSPAVPLLLNASGLPYTSLQRSAPVFGSQAIKLFNPVSTENHWYDLEQRAGSTLYDVFLAQLSNSDPANPNGFEIALKAGSALFAPIQISPEGEHLGFHGAPDLAVNQRFYGSNAFDHIANGGGLQVSVTAGCVISAGAVGNSCNTTVKLTVPEPDTSYSVVCSASGGFGLWTLGNLNTLTTTTFVVPSIAMSNAATGGGNINCQVVHG